MSSAPTVVGTAQAGAKLAGVPGVWNGGKPVTFTYQWQSCDAAGFTCTPIPGATLETYTPTATDVGHALVLDGHGGVERGDGHRELGADARDRARRLLRRRRAPP